jgi:hypothetical protein
MRLGSVLAAVGALIVDMGGAVLLQVYKNSHYEI